MHLELIPVHDVTVGRLLLACRTWGIADAETFALLGGSSPASTASAAGLAAIAQRLPRRRRRAGDARRRPRRRPRGCCRARPTTSPTTAGGPVTQYSPRGVTLIELPEVLLEAIRSAAGDTEPPPADRSGTAAGAGPRVRPGPVRRPPRGRPARATASATTTSPSPSSGRAGSCAGRCSKRAGAWPTAGCSGRTGTSSRLGEDEVAAALAGDATLATRSQRRRAELGMAAEADGAPPQLGDDEGPPPDPGLFPPRDGRAGALDHGRASSSSRRCSARRRRSPRGRATASGSAPPPTRAGRASPAIGRGRPRPSARRRRPRHNADHTHLRGDHADRRRRGHRVRRADRATPRIVCREYGIPAVVGVAGATTHIVDGATADRRSLDRPGAHRRRVSRQPLRGPTARRSQAIEETEMMEDDRRVPYWSGAHAVLVGAAR